MESLQLSEAPGDDRVRSRPCKNNSENDNLCVTLGVMKDCGWCFSVTPERGSAVICLNGCDQTHLERVHPALLTINDRDHCERCPPEKVKAMNDLAKKHLQDLYGEQTCEDYIACSKKLRKYRAQAGIRKYWEAKNDLMALRDYWVVWKRFDEGNMESFYTFV